MARHRHRGLALLVAGVALVAGAARGDPGEAGWALTFSPAALASALPAGAWTVAVIDGIDATDPTLGAGALAAVTSALRASGRARLVIDGTATLGEAARGDDPSVLARAAVLPVQVVAILRARRPDAAEPIGVLALYGRDGRPLRQVIGRRGARGFATAPSGEPTTETDEQAVARAAGRLVTLTVPQATTLKGAKPILGLHPATRLSPAEVYDLVGRRDLAERDRHGRLIRNSLLVAGGLVCVAGFTALIATDYSRAGLIAGPTLCGVGLGPLITGIAWNPDPVPLGEARRLVGDYNRGVRERMETSERDRSREERVVIAPWFGSTGVGLSARLAF